MCEIDASGGTLEDGETRAAARRAEGNEEPAAILRGGDSEWSAGERDGKGWSRSGGIALLRVSDERKESERRCRECSIAFHGAIIAPGSTD
jgi:hypothetical protein